MCSGPILVERLKVSHCHVIILLVFTVQVAISYGKRPVEIVNTKNVQKKHSKLVCLISTVHEKDIWTLVQQLDGSRVRNKQVVEMT